MSHLKYGLLLLILAISEVAIAEQVPGPAEPSRIETNIKEQRFPRVQDKEFFVPGKRNARDINAPLGAENITLKLNEVKISGVRTLSLKDIEAIYSNKIGKQVKLSDVYKIADEITKLYVDKGYVLARAIIPAQSIENGIVKIKVVEGRIGTVKISGEVANSKFLQPALNKLTNSRALNIEELESQILRLNDLAGVKFRSIMKPSNIEGVVNLELIAEKVLYENELYVNNYGSKFLGPLQGVSKLGLNHSLLLPFNRTELTVLATTDTNELKYFDISHSIALNTYGSSLTLHAAHSDSRPGSTQKAFDIKGGMDSYELTFKHVIFRSRSKNFSVELGFKSLDSQTTSLASMISNDKTRVLKTAISYDASDKLRGVNAISLTLSQGIEGLGSSKRGGPNLSRAKGRPDFTKFEASISRLQLLPQDFNLLAVISGQYTKQPLLSSEEFGYGGPAFGRAYDSSEILGDRGVVGLAELRYDGVPILYKTQINPFLYYDFGHIWNIDAGQDKHINASSGGGGFRINLPKGIFGVFTVAKPMDKRQNTPLHGKGGDKPRYGFQLGIRF